MISSVFEINLLCCTEAGFLAKISLKGEKNLMVCKFLLLCQFVIVLCQNFRGGGHLNGLRDEAVDVFLSEGA